VNKEKSQNKERRMKAIELKKIDSYKWGKNVFEGLHFLKIFLNGGPKGNIGDSFFILEQNYNTKKSNDIRWEGHRRYIDIQYMVKGSEFMAVKNIDLMKFNTKYDKTKDFQFFEEKEKNGLELIKVNEGEFLFFFPRDIHKPCIGNNNRVEKIVVKVKI
jgi:YhcH/YjgK/YiaL family protein